MKKTDARSLPTDAQQELRHQAIRLRKSGHSPKDIANIVGVHVSTFHKWWKDYADGGKSAITIKKRGPQIGTGRTLTEIQEQKIQDLIIDKNPDQLKLPFALWTRRAIKELIKRTFELEMPIRTVGEYLRRWNFTPQKPLKKAYEQNQQAVDKWLSEEYPKIKQKALEDNAEIHWGDETGLRSDSQHGRSYAPKGKTPAIRLSAKRSRLNLISTITNQGKVRFMIYSGTMNAQQLIKFLKRLVKNSKKKVYLILDNLRVHHSFVFKNWLEKNREEIQVFYLPSYSPELNPDEYLNCDLKAGVHSREPARNEKEFKNQTMAHMKMLQKKPARVKKYFKHEAISYAA